MSIEPKVAVIPALGTVMFTVTMVGTKATPSANFNYNYVLVGKGRFTDDRTKMLANLDKADEADKNRSMKLNVTEDPQATGRQTSKGGLAADVTMQHSSRRCACRTSTTMTPIWTKPIGGAGPPLTQMTWRWPPRPQVSINAPVFGGLRKGVVLAGRRFCHQALNQM
jgi:hypothetical protein